jgi:hypothetical protein
MICPDFGVATETLRAACEEEYGDDPESMINCLWRANQEMDELVRAGGFKDKAFAAKCQQAYKLMWAANRTGKPFDESGDGELLRPFREMMHRVARHFNVMSWDGILKPTDDFVVVATERIGYWVVEDMESSIPPGKLKKLKKAHGWPGGL